jgi:hypothetical protein
VGGILLATKKNSFKTPVYMIVQTVVKTCTSLRLRHSKDTLAWVDFWSWFATGCFQAGFNEKTHYFSFQKSALHTS